MSVHGMETSMEKIMKICEKYEQWKYVFNALANIFCDMPSGTADKQQTAVP